MGVLEIFFRYVLPRFFRKQYYFRDIKNIRARYPDINSSAEVNAERLRLQKEAADYWRVW